MDHAEHAMGWLRDLPDVRDFRIDQSEAPQRVKASGRGASVREMLSEVGALDTPVAALPQFVDLRAWMSPIEDQGSIGSCTAQAGAGLIEYFERRAFAKHTNASRLFLYKATRNLLQWTGDTGAYLRTTMGAMAIFGVPPEQFWKYNVADFDKEPSAFCYAFGQSFQSLQYYRLDPVGTDPAVLLNRIKTNLATGLPSMFGFTVYSSINQAGTTGAIPFPTGGESILGGHAVVATGFDDNKVIKNTNTGTPTRGALLIRNSWGTGWGQAGYGWLPYAYVLGGAAVDWWSLIKHEWIETGQFGVTTTLAGMPSLEYGAERA
jgi:C1A family cysteine protease